MKKLLTVIGARPQIIKAAAISRAIKYSFSDQIEEQILHTGQHYDTNMSQVFFDELGVPLPNYNLNVGSGNHGAQTAKMITGIENVLLAENFDGVVLYGDTNSTLAGAIAASKMEVPIFHIESGLRSFNMGMPEEVNRIVCDHLSSVLFAPTENAMKNLRKEGFFGIPFFFRNGQMRKVLNCGDVMYDNSMFYGQLVKDNCNRIAREASNILSKNELRSDCYILATIHRNSNTDNSERLTSIFSALLDISETEKIKVALPLHPRTAKKISTNLSSDIYSRLTESKKIVLMPPASFLETIVLEKNAKLVITDSGGVQKESFFFERPSIILRSETEWVEIVENGAGILADADRDRIMNAYNQLVDRQISFPPLFGDSHAAEHIVCNILNYLLGK